jgi:hypothetical protein
VLFTEKELNQDCGHFSVVTLMVHVSLLVQPHVRFFLLLRVV